MPLSRIAAALSRATFAGLSASHLFGSKGEPQTAPRLSPRYQLLRLIP